MDKETYIFLGQVRRTSRKLDERLMHLKFLELRMLPAGIRYDKDKIQTSPSDQMSAFAAEYDETEAQINQLEADMVKQMKEIDAVLDQLPNENEKAVLKMYYLSSAEVKEIADVMTGYTMDGIYSIRRRGIRNVERIRNNS